MSVLVFLRYTSVHIKVLLRISRTSKNEILFSVSISMVNLMFLSLLLYLFLLQDINPFVLLINLSIFLKGSNSLDCI